MYNTTAYPTLRAHQDGSVLDAAATTLFSYFLLRVIQWIVTSNFFVIFGKVLFVLISSGIATALLTILFTATDPSPKPKKGLNGAHYNLTKNDV